METEVNAVGRAIPKEINGKKLIGYKGSGKYKPDIPTRAAPKLKFHTPRASKILPNLKEALIKSGLKDGDTISFHHHFRGGDNVMLYTFKIIKELGIKNLTLSPSSIHPVHAPLIEYIEDGTITNIECGVTGPVGEAISKGKLKGLLTIRSHGGRPRAIESGQTHINVAVIAAPAADEYGNINGVLGDYACGPLGYAHPDARYADYVIAVTNNLVEYPNPIIAIPQDLVDAVVVIDEPIGNPEKIVSGTTRITRDPVRLLIAQRVVDVIIASGLLKDGFSYQSGASGITLATTYFLKDYMEEHNIKGSFASGGSTAALVEMLEKGLFKTILDVQAFDTVAVKSLRDNPNHLEMGSSMYANPYTAGCVVDKLDCVVLGATEIDVNFNVNVVCESNGLIAHGIGGHQDTAEGAKLTIIAAPLLRGRLPIIVDNVIVVTTPGDTVDVVVTERGIAVNPKSEFYEILTNNEQLKPFIRSIETLQQEAEKLAGGKPKPIEIGERIVAIVEHRDGTVLDVIREVKS